MEIHVVLLSGGLDSTVTLMEALREAEGVPDDVVALSVEYGQSHSREINAAGAVAEKLGVLWKVAHVPDVGMLAGHSALTQEHGLLPASAGRTLADIDPNDVPDTYVPARNTILLSLAAALGESRALRVVAYGGSVSRVTLWYGANALDYSGYPDCRPEFYRAMESVLAQGTKISTQYGIPITIAAPLAMLSKGQIVQRGMVLQAPFNLTWSCYAGGERPCGSCDSCLLRAKGFAEMGVSDPALVAEGA